jgi:hypothetical protein
MSEPTACDGVRCSAIPDYCDNCDLIVGLDG